MPTMTHPDRVEQAPVELICSTVTGGVDTHQDTHTAAVIDRRAGCWGIASSRPPGRVCRAAGLAALGSGC